MIPQPAIRCSAPSDTRHRRSNTGNHRVCSARKLWIGADRHVERLISSIKMDSPGFAEVNWGKLHLDEGGVLARTVVKLGGRPSLVAADAGLGVVVAVDVTVTRLPASLIRSNRTARRRQRSDTPTGGVTGILGQLRTGGRGRLGGGSGPACRNQNRGVTTQRRDRLHPDLQQLAQPYRGPVHRAAVLRVGQHRSPQPPRPGLDDPPLHHLAEQTRPRPAPTPSRRRANVA